jgi:hypothetical protein
MPCARMNAVARARSIVSAEGSQMYRVTPMAGMLTAGCACGS